MQALAVVDLFQELSYRCLGFLKIAVFRAVNLFVLKRLDESFGSGVVVNIAAAAHTDADVMPFQLCCVVLGAYCTPRSEWCTKPGCGRRRWIAMRRASNTSPASKLRSSAQPIQVREKASSRTAK